MTRDQANDRKHDAFGDGTPCDGAETSLDSLEAGDLAAFESTVALRSQQRRKIDFNPSEGDVHDRERGRPWRVAINAKIAAANERAQEEQWEKRRFGLAKQVHEGLLHNYNIYVGISEVSNVLKVGQDQRRRETQGDVVENKDIAASAILVAAEKYDLARIAVLLDKVPKKLGDGTK
ncbi:hypothetical protein SDRG_13181 [Saprolegnia diclina VS20]|uniref:Uncharacterized protein n=1 Tax=Saprolegnia diclina (strain VS20) TaxID=1156394 RepID=T0Q6F4_SAPDV|nr:hypothetical protein SDRG_13181 [Saprolegnia diclina VS20]EQC29025.1 hypothetical protein SDRG_13181 [Saprolegnia diclina VS20]|eukprot:XP_008617484.1 hypothetical protein SDRG_13181 [Saprolegnia diclina VS20]